MVCWCCLFAWAVWASLDNSAIADGFQMPVKSFEWFYLQKAGLQIHRFSIHLDVVPKAVGILLN